MRNELKWQWCHTSKKGHWLVHSSCLYLYNYIQINTSIYINRKLIENRTKSGTYILQYITIWQDRDLWRHRQLVLSVKARCGTGRISTGILTLETNLMGDSSTSQSRITPKTTTSCNNWQCCFCIVNILKPEHFIIFVKLNFKILSSWS